MELNDFKAWDRDNPEGEAHGWIQWKGTNVCMDVHCKCGAHCHVDADFAYHLKCPHCGRVYTTGCNVKLIELTPEEKAFIEGGGHIEPIVVEPDEDFEPHSGDSSRG
jgi:hypothetical protein